MLSGTAPSARSGLVREPEQARTEHPRENFDTFFAREREGVLGFAFALTGDRGVASSGCSPS